MKEKKNGRRVKSFLRPLLIFLLLAFVLSSGVLGFILGRNAADEQYGTHRDTILLIPPQSGEEMEETHFLSVVVKDQGGKLLKSHKDEDDQSTVSLKLGSRDEELSDPTGVFRFDNIKTGIYNIETLSEDKEVLASSEVAILFSEDTAVEMDLSNEELQKIFMPTNVRMIELTIKIDGGKLSVIEDESRVTMSNEIVTFSSKKLSLSDGNVAVTPLGNILDSNGYLMIAPSGEVINPNGVVERQSESKAIMPNVEVSSDGDISVGGETGNIAEIKPDGSVTDGEKEIILEDDIIIITDDGIDKVTPDEDYAPPEGPSENGDEDNTNQGTELESEAEKPAEEGTEGNQSEEKPEKKPESGLGSELEPDREEATPSPSPTPEPTPLPTPTPNDKWGVSDKETGISWTQQSTIDLFSRRWDNNRDYNTKNDLIEPGAEGYYLFTLKNDNDFAIEFELELLEQNFHLPIRYSLFNNLDNKQYAERVEADKDTGVYLTPTVEISAHSETSYRLEWLWVYDLGKKTDEVDTELGKLPLDKREYQIALNINAGQKISDFEPDEDTKYPGMKK